MASDYLSDITTVIAAGRVNFVEFVLRERENIKMLSPKRDMASIVPINDQRALESQGWTLIAKETCEACNGTGRTPDEATCWYCDGEGIDPLFSDE